MTKVIKVLPDHCQEIQLKNTAGEVVATITKTHIIINDDFISNVACLMR